MTLFFWIRCLRTVQTIFDRIMCAISNRGHRRQRRHLRHEMHTAKTYQAWRGFAAELDKLEKNDVWRRKVESTCFDFSVVHAQMLSLRALRKDQARLGELLSTLRGILSRSYAGLNAKELFGSSHLGTKNLVENFQSEVLETLRYLSEKVVIGNWSVIERAQFFHYARHSYGRTALCLSGGGALTMYHMGTVRSLIEAGVMPRVVSGTSGGSIVAGMLARYTDEEMLNEVLQENISTKFGVRWFEPFLVQLQHFICFGTLTSPSKFAATCRAYYGDVTFGEAYRHTRRVVSICVTCRGKSSGSHPRLLNYLTSPDVLLWSAVQASCALPGLMPSVELMAKNADTGLEVSFLPGQAVADGSINADLPMQRLAELFNVNNFIVSQVNPHVNPFISSHEVQSAPGRNSTRSLTKHIEYLLNIDVQNRCRKLAKIGLFPRVFGANVSGVFVQRYVGNVTIAPHLSILDNFRAIQHPSQQDMKRYLLVGAQTLWPKLDTIKHMMMLEKELATLASKWNNQSKRQRSASPVSIPMAQLRQDSGGGSRTSSLSPPEKRAGASPSSPTLDDYMFESTNINKRRPSLIHPPPSFDEDDAIRQRR